MQTWRKVISNLHALTERVNELGKGLAQVAENLGEDARRRRESETTIVREREPLHGKGRAPKWETF